MGFDQITPTLWIGDAPPTGPLLMRLGIDTVFLCASEYQPDPTLFHGVKVVSMPFEDKKDFDLDVTIARAAAGRVIRQLYRPSKRRPGKTRRVLVTCRSGENRSGLVVALALVLSTGMSGRDALALVRSRRPGSLEKKSAVKYLESLPAFSMSR